MKKLTKGIVGYLFFFGLLTLNSSLAVVFYSTIENKPKGTIAILILIFITISSLVCTLIDVIRRKIQIEKPVKDILQATKQMAKGDFNVLLLPDHKFNNYTRYDLIKEDLNGWNYYLTGRYDAIYKEDSQYIIYDWKTLNLPKNPSEDLQSIVYLYCASKIFKTEKIKMRYLSIEKLNFIDVEFEAAQKYKNRIDSIILKLEDCD